MPASRVSHHGQALAGEGERHGTARRRGQYRGRACPAPKICSTSSVATSMDHRRRNARSQLPGKRPGRWWPAPGHSPFACGRGSARSGRGGPEGAVEEALDDPGLAVAVLPFRRTATGAKQTPPARSARRRSRCPWRGGRPACRSLGVSWPPQITSSGSRLSHHHRSASKRRKSRHPRDPRSAARSRHGTHPDIPWGTGVEVRLEYDS